MGVEVVRSLKRKLDWITLYDNADPSAWFFNGRRMGGRHTFLRWLQTKFWALLIKSLNADGTSLAKTYMVKLVGLDFMCREGKRGYAESQCYRPAMGPHRPSIWPTWPRRWSSMVEVREATSPTCILRVKYFLRQWHLPTNDRKIQMTAISISAKRMDEHFIKLIASMTVDDRNQKPNAMAARGYALFEPAEQIFKECVLGSLITLYQPIVHAVSADNTCVLGSDTAK